MHLTRSFKFSLRLTMRQLNECLWCRVWHMTLEETEAKGVWLYFIIEFIRQIRYAGEIISLFSRIISNTFYIPISWKALNKCFLNKSELSFHKGINLSFIKDTCPFCISICILYKLRSIKNRIMKLRLWIQN